MSSPDVRLSTAASATALMLLAFIVTGISSSPDTLLLGIVLVPPIILPLWLGAPAIAPARTECRS